MNRRIIFFILVVVVAGLAGWGTAWNRTIGRARRAEERSNAAAVAQSRKYAADFATLARRADEIRVILSPDKEVKTIQAIDPAWLGRVSDVLGKADYHSTYHALWMAFPELSFCSHGGELLKLTMYGGVLRCYVSGDSLISGDFIVGTEIVDALFALAAEKAGTGKVE